MNLYLHIGHNKTGSSFLQTIFAQNRDLLKSNGYFFPIDKKFEKKMLEGIITPGNGFDLNKGMLENDIKKVKRLLKEYIRSAKQEMCNKILISNERLFVTFSHENNLKTFINICDDLAIKNIYTLTFLREPVAHLISMYKHRSKTGKNIDFENWLQQDYETVHVYKNFLKLYNKYPIDWTLRKYKKDSSILLKVTFKDWLNIKQEPKLFTRPVNPSLKLSEILLLQNIYKESPYLVDVLNKYLLQLPLSEKARDKELEQYYKFKAVNFLNNFKSIYDEFNLLLPIDEKLKLELESNSKGNKISILSTQQLELLSLALIKSKKVNTIIKYKWNKLKLLIASFLNK